MTTFVISGMLSFVAVTALCAVWRNVGIKFGPPL